MKKFLSDALNCLKDDITGHLHRMNDKDGNPNEEPSSVVYFKDLWAVYSKIVKERNIRDPVLKFGIDGGQGKIIMVMFIHDLAASDDDDSDDMKPGGQNRGIVVARADNASENRDNVEYLAKTVGLFEFLSKLPEDRYNIIGDLKMCNLLTG